MIIKSNFENLLKTKWTEWLDRSQLMRQTMIDTRDAKLETVNEPIQISSPVKITVSSISLIECDSPFLEINVDFQISREDGIAIGFHVYKMDLGGKLKLADTHGCLFKQHPNT